MKYDFRDKINRQKMLRVFLITFCFGCIINIMGMVHDLLNHDSIILLSTDFHWLSFQGKWNAGYIFDALRGVISTPSLFMPVGLALFALSACLITAIFHIRSVAVGVAVGLVLVSSERVVSMTLYYGTDYFAAVFTLAVLAVYLTRSFRFGWLCAIPVLTLSVGGYQPYLSVATALFVLISLMDALSGKKSLIEIFKEGLKYIGVLLASGIAYYLILRLVMSGGVQLSSYAGINELVVGGGMNSRGFIKNVLASWFAVYSYIAGGQSPAYEGFRWLYPTIGILMVGAFVHNIFAHGIYRKPLMCLLSVVLLFLFFPLGVNLVSILAQVQSCHSIMKYSFVILIIATLILLDASPLFDEASVESALNRFRLLCRRTARIVAFSVFALFFFFSALMCNDIYAYVRQANEQFYAKSVCLMSSIYASDELASAECVALVGDNYQPFFRDDLAQTNSVSYITTLSVGIDNTIGLMGTPGVYETYLTKRLGFQLPFTDRTQIYQKYRELCDEMPVYPQQGSICMVDGILIVKLNECSTS